MSERVFSRFSRLVEDPEGFERPTDAQAIEDRVITELGGVYFSSYRRDPLNQQREWESREGATAFYYRNHRFGEERFVIKGKTSVARSRIAARLDRQGASEAVTYWLRGEMVEDDYRIAVVRRGLGLLPTPSE